MQTIGFLGKSPEGFGVIGMLVNFIARSFLRIFPKKPPKRGLIEFLIQ
ncbi:MAG: hypothetical protein CM15mP22_6110 [Gammaproteobacteria bacterium]|nr:MAG: hypothetical protein CM15mP22_6110 [Gammaproteobacteria bacterium]